MLKYQGILSCSGYQNILLILLFLINVTAFAKQPGNPDLIEINAPWIRAPAPFAHALGGFMLLKNLSDIPVTLVQAKAEGFDEVMIHKSISENGMHRMEYVENIVIDPHKELRFEHGSYHIMFMGLHRKIRPGDKVPVTLIFKKGLEKSVLFTVRKPD